MAEVIDGHTGLMFVWGLYVKGALLPGSLTYVYGIFQVRSEREISNRHLVVYGKIYLFKKLNRLDDNVFTV